MRLDFYHWGYQCPLNDEMLRLLARYADRLELHIHDITGNPGLAMEQRMFFPTLAVAEGRRRYFAPLTVRFLDALCSGLLPEELPYRPKLGRTPVEAAVRPIRRENCTLAGRCTGRERPTGCMKKAGFLQAMGLEVFGFQHLRGTTLLGGAEYVPSLQVPYPIPKDNETAFLTCVYCTDNRYDGKTAPLRTLEAFLSSRYRRVCAVCDEAGIFPNGDLAFFLGNGYRDRGVVSVEPGYCTLHLMEKQI